MKDEDHEPVPIPIDGILDLHLFSPKDAASVVEEYLQECIRNGIYELRIVHGKGKGVLRRTVHRVLENHPHVSGFGIDPGASGWGATLVQLKR